MDPVVIPASFTIPGSSLSVADVFVVTVVAVLNGGKGGSADAGGIIPRVTGGGK